MSAVTPPPGKAPFLLRAPRSLAPIVLSCEHATNRLPGHVPRSAAERAVLRSHWGWDIGGWALTTELARLLGTSAIGGRWSRLWIDLNRRPDDPTLIRRVAEGVELSWNAGAGVAETERRVFECHVPYHAELDRLILRRVLRGVRPLLLAVHTFTPLYEGRVRDFDVGVLFDVHRGLARAIGRTLAGAGLAVRYNRPYSGLAGMMYSIDRHGSHHGLPCLELEVNQRLFERTGNARRLARIVGSGLTFQHRDRDDVGR